MNIMVEEKHRPAADQYFLSFFPPLLLAWRGLPCQGPQTPTRTGKERQSGATLYISLPPDGFHSPLNNLIDCFPKFLSSSCSTS